MLQLPDCQILYVILVILREKNNIGTYLGNIEIIVNCSMFILLGNDEKSILLSLLRKLFFYDSIVSNFDCWFSFSSFSISEILLWVINSLVVLVKKVSSVLVTKRKIYHSRNMVWYRILCLTLTDFLREWQLVSTAICTCEMNDFLSFDCSVVSIKPIFTVLLQLWW